MNKILKRLSITSEPEDTTISTLNQIVIDTKDPIIKKIQEKFISENQQEIFKLSFNLFIKYKDSGKDEFVIDLDEVYNFIGFSRKDSAKRMLEKCLLKDIDYKVFHKVVENSNGGRPIDIIMIKIKAFKKFCLKAQTEVSEQIYEYYLTMDPRFYFVKCSLRSLFFINCLFN